MAFDAHVKPTEALRSVFKKYQKANAWVLHADEDLIDFERGLTEQQCTHLRTHPLLGSSHRVHKTFAAFLGTGHLNASSESLAEPAPVSYSHDDFSGLHLVPSLLPMGVQMATLAKLLHRDLALPSHKTNVHFHHDLRYPNRCQQRSFFDLNPHDESIVVPKDSTLHKPMSVGQFLSRKLRWCTLGGQYDWTRKVYPEEKPPAFPADIQQLLHDLFPKTMPEAAIINLYSPGDVLSLHRDVSEQCANGLISISIGCDAIFMVALDNVRGHNRPPKHLAVRIRSGDAIYMDGPSRYAWHGVPLIISDTCPAELEHWPAAHIDELRAGLASDPYQQWTSWMKTKRINLNVRQMYEDGYRATVSPHERHS